MKRKAKFDNPIFLAPLRIVPYTNALQVRLWPRRFPHWNDNTSVFYESEGIDYILFIGANDPSDMAEPGTEVIGIYPPIAVNQPDIEHWIEYYDINGVLYEKVTSYDPLTAISSGKAPPNTTIIVLVRKTDQELAKKRIQHFVLE